MSRCRDCNACSFEKKVNFDTDLCIFICNDCFKARQNKDKSKQSNITTFVPGSKDLIQEQEQIKDSLNSFERKGGRIYNG